MKLLVLLLIAASLAVTPSAVLAPGDGDAAAAVAAQNKGVVAPQGGTQNGTMVLLMSGSSKLIHLEGGTIAGQKPFKSTVKTGDAIACIQHDAGGCTDQTVPENDADPGVYLFFDSVSEWRIATNPAGTDALELSGLVDGKGGFHMAGTYAFPDAFTVTSVYLTGKVTFEKGTLVPKKISGKLQAVSIDNNHYGSGSFKAVPFVN